MPIKLRRVLSDFPTVCRISVSQPDASTKNENVKEEGKRKKEQRRKAGERERAAVGSREP